MRMEPKKQESIQGGIAINNKLGSQTSLADTEVVLDLMVLMIYIQFIAGSDRIISK